MEPFKSFPPTTPRDARDWIILDLDNCISDDRARASLIDWTTDDPDARYEAYHKAAPNDPIANEHIFRDWEGRVAIFTSRPEWMRFPTEKWLSKHNVPHDVVFMRPVGDRRSSVQLKMGFLGRLQHMLVHRSLAGAEPLGGKIFHAYDDRRDIVEAYIQSGIPATQVAIHDVDMFKAPFENESPSSAHQEEAAQITADAILAEMAQTYRQRNAVYGNNFQMVGPVMKLLFPDGAPANLLGHDAFHLFELVIVKLSRLAVSNLTHIDSAHDAAVYCAMIESIIRSKDVRKN